MHRSLASIAFAVGLFFGMLLLLELGRRLGLRRKGKAEDAARPGLGAVEGAVFGLLGLMIAFTFSGAATRFDNRRQLIIEEANAIGTAWLRLDLLPPAAQPELRDLFRQYVDARLAVYEKMPDLKAALAETDHVNGLQNKIWSRAVAAGQESPSVLAVQLVPALNEMFDLAATRMAVSQIHPPTVIFLTLAVLALTSALLAGYAMAGGQSRSWIHVIGFALILAATVYVILDLEFPRVGFIRVDGFDQLLRDVRRSMN